MTVEDGMPWFTVELQGVVLHVPLEPGKVFTLPMTPDGAYALIGELAQKLDLLKTPAVQKKIASKALDLVIDWIANSKGKKT